MSHSRRDFHVLLAIQCAMDKIIKDLESYKRIVSRICQSIIEQPALKIDLDRVKLYGVLMVLNALQAINYHRSY